MMYDVQKEKGGMFYVCKSGESKSPVPGSFRKEKKAALKLAAELMGISVKDYLKLRKGDK